jgi:hypothetical protein
MASDYPIGIFGNNHFWIECVFDEELWKLLKCVISEYQTICFFDSDPVPRVLITIGFSGGGVGGGLGIGFDSVAPILYCEFSEILREWNTKIVCVCVWGGGGGCVCSAIVG